MARRDDDADDNLDMTIAPRFDQALRDAGVPIHGVSIGDPLRRSSWSVQFASDANDDDRAIALDLLRTGVTSAVPPLEGVVTTRRVASADTPDDDDDPLLSTG